MSLSNAPADGTLAGVRDPQRGRAGGRPPKALCTRRARQCSKVGKRARGSCSAASPPPVPAVPARGAAAQAAVGGAPCADTSCRDCLGALFQCQSCRRQRCPRRTARQWRVTERCARRSSQATKPPRRCKVGPGVHPVATEHFHLAVWGLDGQCVRILPGGGRGGRRQFPWFTREGTEGWWERGLRQHLPIPVLPRLSASASACLLPHPETHARTRAHRHRQTQTHTHTHLRADSRTSLTMRPPELVLAAVRRR